MHATATLNGRFERRTLNDSIGRLDSILDGLGEAIPATIRETLRDTVGKAVAEGIRAAIVEIAARPDFATLLPQGKPRPASPLKRGLNALQRLASMARALAAGTVRRSVRAIRGLRALAAFKRPIALAVVVGAGTGILCSMASPWVAGTVTGVAGLVSTLAVQAGLWFRRMTMGSAMA